MTRLRFLATDPSGAQRLYFIDATTIERAVSRGNQHASRHDLTLVSVANVTSLSTVEGR
jgi:hypothetical protein